MTIRERVKAFCTSEGSATTQVAVFVVYVVVILISIFFHEPWQDEAQAWLLATGVGHPGELLQYMKYEGSPMLWHTVLWVVAKTGVSYTAIQFVNAFIMIAAAAVVVFKTRLPLLAKIAVLLSYPFLYLYGVIARSYGLMTLLMVAVAAMHEQRIQKPLVYGVLLFLLSQVNFFGLLVAVFLAAMHLEATIRNGTSVHAGWLVGPLIGLSSIGTVLLLLPNADVGQHLTAWNFGFGLDQVYDITSTITATFFPLAPWGIEYWNTVIFTVPVMLVGIAGGLLSFIAVRRSRFAAGMYLITGASIYLFLLFKGLRRVRFYESIFIVFIMAVIILYNEARKKRMQLPVSTAVAVILVLLLQVAPAITAVRFDTELPFSYSREIAEYMQAEWQPGSHVLAYPQTAALSSFAHIAHTEPGAATYFALDLQDERSFALWSQEYYENIPLEHNEIARRAIAYSNSRSNTDNLFLLSEFELTDSQLLQHFQLVQYYDDAIVESERLYLYISK